MGEYEKKVSFRNVSYEEEAADIASFELKS